MPQWGNRVNGIAVNREGTSNQRDNDTICVREMKRLDEKHTISSMQIGPPVPGKITLDNELGKKQLIILGGGSDCQYPNALTTKVLANYLVKLHPMENSARPRQHASGTTQ